MRVTSRKRILHAPELTGRPVPTKPAPRPAKVVRALALGDWVEIWAKPIARMIDQATGDFGPRAATKLAGCSQCSKRRRWLNLAVPDVRSWRSWAAAPGRLLPAWRAVYGCRSSSARR